MPVQVHCPNPECGQAYSVAEEHLGRSAHCRSCGKKMSLRPSAEAVGDSLHSSATGSGTGTLPDQLGRFRVRSRLGAGAFGTVYHAHDPMLDREVALKVPHPAAVESPKAAERFLREAKAAGALRHPHIVPIYDAGFDDSRFYIASAYVEGRTLSRVIDEEQIDVRRAANIVVTLAEALNYAHREGIVHRDVKPSNIILDSRGEPHLMDFGLARLEGSQEKLTHDGAVLGTPAYMAPEQAKGQVGDAKPAADQYSLGVVLYELLCGETPFSGPPEIVIYNVLKQEVPAPRTKRPDVPRDLETICLKALSKEPEGRYDSCEEFAADLRRWLADEPIRARRVGWPERVWRWAKRNPAPAGLGSAVAGLLLFFALAAPVVALREASLRDDAESKAREAQKAKALADEEANRRAAEAKRATDALRREAKARQEADLARERADREAQRAREQELQTRRNLYRAHMNMAAEAWEVADVGRVHDLLAPYLPGTGQEDFRGLEWYYWWKASHSYSKVFDAGGQPLSDVEFSPDGTLIAYASATGPVTIVESATGRIARTLDAPTRALAFSPDGELLATGSITSVSLWDVSSGTQQVTFKKKDPGATRDIVFSRGGRKLAVANKGGAGSAVDLWDRASGESQSILAAEEAKSFCLDLSPDGETLAIGSPGKILLIDAATGALKATLDAPGSYWVVTVAFSPDGTSLASLNGDITLWDVETGEETLSIPRGHTHQVLSLTFSPDGTTLASGAEDRTVKLWDANTGKRLANLKGHAGYVTSVAFSPDGLTLVSASEDGTLKQWDLSGPATVLRGHTRGVVKSVAFSPDGKTLASGGEDNTARLWDVATGRLRATLDAQGWWVDAMAFSPDGATLATSGKDAEIKLWNLATGSVLTTLNGHPARLGHVHTLAFAPEGMILASGSRDQTVKLWDVVSGRLRSTLEENNGPVMSVAFSPSGETLAAGRAGGTIELWNARAGSLGTILRGHTGAVNSVAFLADGKTVVSGSADRTVKLWSLKTGEPMKTFSGHAAVVSAVAASPDGTRILSASHDGTLKVWGLDADEAMTTLWGHAGYVYCLAVSPNGRTVASGHYDGTVRLWRTTTDAEVLSQEDSN